MSRKGDADEVAARVQAELAHIAERLGEPRVRAIRVLASGRLSASLARAYPERAEVRVATGVFDSPYLAEVLRHEVAHIVCYWRHGRTRPHGSEWRSIVQAAGGTAATRLSAPGVRLAPRRRRTPQGLRAARELLRRWL